MGDYPGVAAAMTFPGSRHPSCCWAIHSRVQALAGSQSNPARGAGRNIVPPSRRPQFIQGALVGEMKFTGDISIGAPREAVFAKVRDARFFASCIEGVQALNEIDPDHYTAVLETKVAYLKFKFNVVVEVVRSVPPSEIEARIEGAPLGIVGRLTASSVTRLSEDNGGTRVSYEVDAVLTGKLGSLGQPVLRAKAKDMERQFAERLRAAFAPAASGAAQ
jgi:carbon monoxide dehydrogenase subunit G